MKTVVIRTIPHQEQRYDTAGDYEEYEDRIEFRISDTGNGDFDMAIAIHELVEKHLASKAGITDKQIDEFDFKFVPNDKFDEPGLDPMCPVHSQHMKADSIEREFIIFCGDDWEDYASALEELEYDR